MTTDALHDTLTQVRARIQRVANLVYSDGAREGLEHAGVQATLGSALLLLDDMIVATAAAPLQKEAQP